MDSAKTARDHNIDSYLRGRMSEQERNAFEVRLLEDPRFLEDVQYADALQGALKRHAKELGAGHASAPPQNTWVRPYAAAASVMLGLSLAAGGVLYYQVDTLKAQLADARQPTSVDHMIVFEATRGVDNDRRTVDAGDTVLVRIDIAGRIHPAYVVEFSRQAGEAQPLLIDDLEEDEDGMLSLTLPSISAGDYSLAVSGVKNGSQHDIATYRIVVEVPTVDDT